MQRHKFTLLLWDALGSAYAVLHLGRERREVLQAQEGCPDKWKACRRLRLPKDFGFFFFSFGFAKVSLFRLKLRVAT